MSNEKNCNEKTCNKKNTVNPNIIISVLQLIEKISKKYSQAQRQIIGSMNFTSAQISILQTLWKGDLVPLKDLAICCCCTRATITGIVDTLEKKGLVTRQAHPSDRRSILISLSEEGKKIKKEIPSLDKIYNKYCQILNSEDFEILNGLLDKFYSSIE